MLICPSNKCNKQVTKTALMTVAHLPALKSHIRIVLSLLVLTSVLPPSSRPSSSTPQRTARIVSVWPDMWYNGEEGNIRWEENMKGTVKCLNGMQEEREFVRSLWCKKVIRERSHTVRFDSNYVFEFNSSDTGQSTSLSHLLILWPLFNGLLIPSSL